MRQTPLYALAIIMWALPVLAGAATVELYDFRSESVRSLWNTIGPVTVEARTDGLLVSVGSETGILVTQTTPPFLPDMGSILTRSERDISAKFLWSFLEGKQHQIHNVPILIDSESSEAALFTLSRHSSWGEGRKNLGILFPPNTTVLVRQVTLEKATFGEKVTSVLRSFWTFDRYRPYSINFVWGPVIGSNPAEVSLLYRHLPPEFIYGVWIIHITLFGLFLIGGIGIYFFHHPKVGRLLVGIVIGAWILLDIHMGSEFLSWVLHDHRTYIAASPSVREFRERDRFYDFVEFAAPLVQDRRRYIFLAEYPWPYLGNMRYLTYPILPGFNIQEDDTWVVYRRKDVGISTSMQIVVGETAVSEPGKVLGVFEDGSFVFRGKPFTEAPK